MVEDGEGFLYPKTDKRKCTGCKLCEKVCPKDEKRLEGGDGELYFGARAKDDSLRFKSSSGGIFPVLALAVLEKGGTVFGASLCDDGVVRHIAVSESNELECLQKTKYVQSRIGFSFRQVKELSEKGIPVLFTGTPCQCRALRLFLGRDYDELIIADIICYGVPSPGIWKKYLAYLEGKHGGPIKDFSFRDKRNRDRGHTVSYIANGEDHACELNSDAYSRSYFRNEIIRPSCHECAFCTPVRSSDITLGDFWGIEKIHTDIEDGMGTSIVIIHSEKGKKAFDGISEKLLFFPCTKEQAMQPRLCTPTAPSPRRDRVMHLYRLLPFSIWIGRR